MKMSYERKKRVIGYGFIAFWVIGFISFFLRPMIMAVMFSLSKLTIDNGIQYAWVGILNYQTALLKDAAFIKHMTSAVTSIFLEVPMIVIFSLFIATMLNQKMRGRVAYRIIFFLPVIIASGVIIGIIKNDPLSQTVMGGGSGGSSLLKAFAFEQLLLEAGLPQQFVNTLTATINGIFELVWKSGIQIILCIAGLSNVSSSLYEASQIEGASAWEIFWKITFPMVSPILVVCVVYTIIDSFTDYSNTLMNFINSTAQRLNFEYSATLAMIYFAVIAVITAIVYAFINKRVFYIND